MQNDSSKDAGNDIVHVLQSIAQILSGIYASRLLEVSRQNNTTNSVLSTLRIEHGYGVMPTGAANFKQEAVTFRTAFASAPIVLLTYGGDDTGSGVNLGDGGVENAGDVVVWAHTITASGFTARLQRTGGANWGANDTTFYQWVAFGS